MNIPSRPHYFRCNLIKQVGNIFNISRYGGNPQDGRIYSIIGIAPCISTRKAPIVVIYEDKVRFRKLTPRECFRLMDVDEEYINCIQTSRISKSQQYKLAGNSIVVAVLYHIFRKMFVDTLCEDFSQSPKLL